MIKSQQIWNLMDFFAVEMMIFILTAINLVKHRFHSFHDFFCCIFLSFKAKTLGKKCVKFSHR